MVVAIERITAKCGLRPQRLIQLPRYSMVVFDLGTDRAAMSSRLTVGLMAPLAWVALQAQEDEKAQHPCPARPFEVMAVLVVHSLRQLYSLQ